MKAKRSTCPDCETELQIIKLMDATERNLITGSGHHVDLEYAAPDATASFFTHTVPSKGYVWGKICPACGRILLYGEPFLT